MQYHTMPKMVSWSVDRLFAFMWWWRAEKVNSVKKLT